MDGLELEAPANKSIRRALAFFVYAISIGVAIRLASPFLVALLQR